MCRPPMISGGKLSERFLLSTVICIAFWGASLLQAPRVPPQWGGVNKAIPTDSACMHLVVAGALPNKIKQCPTNRYVALTDNGETESQKDELIPVLCLIA